MYRLIDELKKGIVLNGDMIHVSSLKKGRFIEEVNAILSLNNKILLHAKIFKGRGKYYKPWVELFFIERDFYGSPFEPELYRKIYEHLSFGGRIFVEYWEDKETLSFLSKGGKPEESRLGKLLLKAGFVGLRDWYIPEGLKEGYYKLQGEKLAK